MNDQELFVKMAMDNWNGQMRAVNSTLDKLSDEQLMNEVSQSRNRGVYLLGHLTAVHDLMLPLLRFSESVFPDLQSVFLEAPDKTIAAIPQVSQLRLQWKEVNEKLLTYFNALSASEWFSRHANVSEEDFISEPHRNRLNVVLGRAAHLSYHRGQLVLLLEKNKT